MTSAHVDAPTTATAVVETSAGKLRGQPVDGVHAFLGVPYGASTAGPRRFLPPAPPTPWTGVREAQALGQRSPQGGRDILFRLFPDLERTEPEGEDCLCLNVWTPGTGSGRRPVMVWLHGGGYISGSGGFTLYDGANLARHEDVVAVTVNHRLNVFGFLDVATVGGERYAQSVNLGLQDIIAALSWVRANIDRFGGDPGNVTIYGESGGGGKVSTLLAMPAACGLFHRAIVQSGSALRQNSRELSADLAAQLLAHLQAKDVDELQRLPMEQLRDAVTTLLERSPGFGARPAGPGGRAPFSALTLGPVVDGQWLPAHPFDPIAPSMSADVPLLVGYNETETTFFPGIPLDPIDEPSLRAQIQGMFRTDGAGAEAVMRACRERRPADAPIDLLHWLQSEQFLGNAARAQADRKAALGGAAVYGYHFDWRSPVHGGRLKSFHTLEIPFVMQNVGRCRSMVGAAPEVPRLADQISGAWAAFARSGRPDHAGLPHWPAYDPQRRAMMVLDANPRVVDDPYRAQRDVVAAVSHSPQAAA